MPVTARLSRSLHQNLGDQGAEDLVNWMVHMDASRSELQAVMDGYISRTEMRFEVNEHKMEAGFLRMETRMAVFEAKMERRFSDLYKWSFVFWIGTFTALAALARVTR